VLFHRHGDSCCFTPLLNSVTEGLRELGVNLHIWVDLELQVRREEELHITLSAFLEKVRELLEAPLSIDYDPKENSQEEEAQPSDPVREATLEAIHMVYGPIIQREAGET
jgi:hypothetical protein